MLLMTTQVIKAIKVLPIIATVRSQILCQLTPTMICGLKSLTFSQSIPDSELSNVVSLKV